MSQRDVELEFWKGLKNSRGDGYIDFRAAEYPDKTKNFPGFEQQKGLGLDLGCGLVSVFEKSGKHLFAVDPLMDEYLRLIPQDKLKLPYSLEDGENLTFADETFDWVFCVNVIDHTPHPGKMADEIHRILKPRGRLYFEVNFDDHLSPAHYGIWDRAMVDDVLRHFNLLHILIERLNQHQQSRLWGIYEKN